MSASEELTLLLKQTPKTLEDYLVHYICKSTNSEFSFADLNLFISNLSYKPSFRKYLENRNELFNKEFEKIFPFGIEGGDPEQHITYLNTQTNIDPVLKNLISLKIRITYELSS